MKELSEAEACALATKYPMPVFDTQEDEIETARDFLRANERGMACIILGLSTWSIKKRWKEYRRERLNSRRFSAWCLATGTKWDVHRGKFVSLNPEISQ